MIIDLFKYKKIEKMIKLNICRTMKSVEIAELFVFMKQMAFISGDMIKEAYDKPKNVDTKSSAADLVPGLARL